MCCAPQAPHAVTAATGATAIAVYATQATNPHLHLIHSAGYPPEVAQAFALIRADAALPVADAARTRTAVWLGDQQAWRGRYPNMAVGAAALLLERPDLIIDLSEVRFLGSSGLQALISTHHRAESHHGQLHVVTGGHRVVTRPITITALDRVLRMHPDLRTALDALPAASS